MMVEKRTWQPPAQTGDEPIRSGDLREWLRQAGLDAASSEINRLDGQDLTLTQFATLLYRSIRSSGLRKVIVRDRGGKEGQKGCALPARAMKLFARGR